MMSRRTFCRLPGRRTGLWAAAALSVPLLLCALLAAPGAGDAAPDTAHSGPRPAYWIARPVPEGLTQRADRPVLRAVTYNLHSGLGGSWRPFAGRQAVEDNLRRIARAIADAGRDGAPVDVVALNEVDFASRRSGWIDQAGFLARELGAFTGTAYRAIRGETWRRDLPGLEVRFGNALLVRHPVLEVENHLLGGDAGPAGEGGLLGRFLGEPRGALRVRIAMQGGPLDVVVTHLDAFRAGEREAQAAELLADVGLRRTPTLLLGDVNTVPWAMTGERRPFPRDRTHDVLTAGPLIDARVGLAADAGQEDLAVWATYPAHAPRWPLDGVFATADFLPRRATVVGDESSDHRGLAVEFGWLTSVSRERYARWHRSLPVGGRPAGGEEGLARTGGEEPARAG